MRSTRKARLRPASERRFSSVSHLKPGSGLRAPRDRHVAFAGPRDDGSPYADPLPRTQRGASWSPAFAGMTAYADLFIARQTREGVSGISNVFTPNGRTA